MAKKTYSVRIYATHDPDLVKLIRYHRFDVVKALYISLSAFCRKQNIRIESPPEYDDPPLKPRYYFARILTLDTEEDFDLIRVIDSCEPGKRNYFFRFLLRFYLCNPMGDTFFSDPFLIEDKISAFYSGKRVVSYTYVTKGFRKKWTSSYINEEKSITEKKNKAPEQKKEFPKKKPVYSEPIDKKKSKKSKNWNDNENPEKYADPKTKTKPREKTRPVNPNQAASKQSKIPVRNFNPEPENIPDFVESIEEKQYFSEPEDISENEKTPIFTESSDDDDLADLLNGFL